MRRIRPHLTFANVTSSIALFVALGGTSFAVVSGSIGSSQIADNSVRSGDIRNRTITSRDVKRNSLGGLSIKESRLHRVPHALNADRLGGTSAGALRLRCPGGTRLVADACVETSTRPLQAYGGAEGQCRIQFRRVATYEEVNGILAASDISLAPGGELTGTVIQPQGNGDDHVQALAVTQEGGGATVVPDTAAGAKPFRCALDPTNSSPGAR